MPSSRLTFRALEVVIQASEDLLTALRCSHRESWPAHISTFFGTVARHGPSEAEVLLVVLHTVGRRVQAAMIGRPAPPDSPHMDLSLSCGELLEHHRRQWVLWAGSGPDKAGGSAAQRACRVIEERYAEPLTLAAVAATVGRERTYLAWLFRQEIGLTIHHYITRVRIRHATRLIRDGHKVEAVMLMVGYRSKKNFYRQFKALTGRTPGAFRSPPGALPLEMPASANDARG